MPHRPLHVVPEDPQVQHVSQNVEEAAVEEHGCEDIHPNGERGGRGEICSGPEFSRNEPVLDHEVITFGDWIQAPPPQPLVKQVIEPRGGRAQGIPPGTSIDPGYLRCGVGELINK